MQRQVQFAEQVNQLIDILGPDAQIEVAPGVFQSFANTPAGKRAQLDMIELDRSAELASIEYDRKKQLDELDFEKNLAALTPEEKAPVAVAGGLLPPRSDGSEFQSMDGSAAPTDPLAGIDPDVVAALSNRITETVRASMPAPAPEAAPAETSGLSLRQVFGANGDFVGIVMIDGERVRVRAGDDLPNGIKVTTVGEDFVEIETGGNSKRLSIRG
jgi:type IV pilus biogenesis protein PilP